MYRFGFDDVEVIGTGSDGCSRKIEDLMARLARVEDAMWMGMVAG